MEFSLHLIDMQEKENLSINIEKLQKCVQKLQDAAFDANIDMNKILIRKRRRGDDERAHQIIKRWRH